MSNASEAIEREIQREIRELEFKLGTDVPVSEIPITLNQTLLYGGKRFRPLLCLMMSRFFRVPFVRIAPIAMASERVHAATLAHDDVIDEATLRRNRASINARSSNARAVLAGDLLLSKVMLDVVEVGNLEIVKDLARTICELVEGEWLQLEARGIMQVQRKDLERVAILKTASLFKWCCTTPARLAGVSDEILATVRIFGENLGLAFQMIDDALDFSSTSGKSYAKDYQEGLVNYVLMELLEENPLRAQKVGAGLGKVLDEKNMPWQTPEIDHAIALTKARARLKLEAARAAFIRLENMGEFKNDSGALPIHHLLDKIVERAS